LVTFPTSPGQGALGIVSRKDNVQLIELLQKIEDPETRNAIEAERSLSMYVDSGCRFPVGAFAHKKDNRLRLKVIVYSVDGSKSIMVEKDSEINQANDLGKQVAAELKEKGISDIAKNWREKVEEWNTK
jgi:hydroxymethylbilane synthase